MRRIISFIIFDILFLILSLLLIFIFDLTNGPLFLFILELVLIVLVGLSRIVMFLKKTKTRWKLIPWGIFIIVSGFFISASKPEIKRLSADLSGNAQKTEVLELENGKVQGIYNEDKTVEIYAGIPYAKAPVGELRWKEPQDVENWDGVRDASMFAPRSMQTYSSPVMDTLVNMYASKSWRPDYNSTGVEEASEDSLYLNIWKPNNNLNNLPILVFIHGGSLTSGSSSFIDYNGEEMAKKNVIMITITYRLGIFGYFASQELIDESTNNTTGNYGLLDQIKALEWVNKNASYFGGDKNNITVAGESAGSSSVSALCVSPLAKGLFKRAIGESSSIVLKNPPHTFRTLDNALETGKKVYEEFNCSNIEDLRKVPASELVKTETTNSGMTIDGYALKEMPYLTYEKGENNEEALLNGYNVKEADPFVIPIFLFSPTNKDNINQRLAEYFNQDIADKFCDLYKDKIEKDAFEVFNEIISVYWFIYPHHSWTKYAINNNIDVYRYHFTKENGYYGTYHSGEMVYAYGNISKKGLNYAYDDTDLKLSNYMLNYWANFIKTGNPNGEGLPVWNKYETLGDDVLELGENVSMIKDRYLEAYKLIEEYNNSIEG